MWHLRRQRDVASHDEAQVSQEQATRARIDATAQRLKADELARRFERAKQRNHFGEAVARAMRGKP